MNSIKRLISILAESNISEKDLIEALNDISRMGWRAFSQDVIGARRSRVATESGNAMRPNRKLASQVSGGKSGRQSTTGRFTGLISSQDDLAEQIDRLLRIEAGLSSAEAAYRLMDALPHGKLPEQFVVQSTEKTSFRDWVRKIATVIPARELLRAATLARNASVHGNRSDWPLKR